MCCFQLPPSSSVCCSHLPPSSCCWRALPGEESPATTETKCSTPTQCTHLYLACNNLTQSTASSSAVLNITQWESHAAVCVRCSSSSSSSSGEVAVHNVRWAVGRWVGVHTAGGSACLPLGLVAAVGPAVTCQYHRTHRLTVCEAKWSRFFFHLWVLVLSVASLNPVGISEVVLSPYRHRRACQVYNTHGKKLPDRYPEILRIKRRKVKSNGDSMGVHCSDLE